MFSKMNMLSWIPYFLKEITKTRRKKSTQKLSQYGGGAFRFFKLLYFVYCSIWLNILVDYCHLSNSRKLKNQKTLCSLALKDNRYCVVYRFLIHFYINCMGVPLMLNVSFLCLGNEAFWYTHHQENWNFGGSQHRRSFYWKIKCCSSGPPI